MIARGMIILCMTALLSAVATSSASAGTYNVEGACLWSIDQAAPGYFVDSSGSQCGSNGFFTIASENTPGPKLNDVVLGSFRAPKGIALEALSMSVNLRGQGWTSAWIFREGGTQHGSEIVKCPAGPNCDGNGQYSGRINSAPAYGATAFRTLIRCERPEGNCDRTGEITGRDITVTLFDSTPADVEFRLRQQNNSRPLKFPWVDSNTVVDIVASDASGIRRNEWSIAGGASGTRLGKCGPGRGYRPCDEALTTSVPLRSVAGLGTLKIEAQLIDGSGEIGTALKELRMHDITGRADYEVELSPTGWKSDDARLLSWPKLPRDGAPIVEVAVRLCKTDECVTQRLAGASLKSPTVRIPSAGEWVATVDAVDAAGRSHTKKNLRVAYDPSAPIVDGFTQTAGSPSRLVLAARDPDSPIVSREVRTRRLGATEWRNLTVNPDARGATIDLPDHLLPSGRYEFEATVVNAAGLKTTTRNRVGGGALRLDLPLRSSIVIRAGRPSKRCTSRRCPRRAVSVREGEQAQLKAWFLDRARRPLAAAPVEVWERDDAPGSQWRKVASPTTGKGGGVRYTAPAGVSRQVEFRYPGSAISLPSQLNLPLRVTARSTLKISRKRVTVGKTVRFSGRTSRPASENDRVRLQRYAHKRWRTFAVVRVAADGRWSRRYRIKKGSARSWQIRARACRQPSYPLYSGSSHSKRLTVRAR